MNVTAPEADPDETTTRVLDAAFAEFVELGIRRASVDSVAQRAGLGRMTVYRRFAGKDALVQAVLVRESHRFLATLASSVEASTSVAQRIESGFVAGVLAWHRHPLRKRLMEREPEAALAYLTYEAGPILATVFAFIKARLGEARDADEISAASIDVACEATVRLAQSYSMTPPWDAPLDAATLRKAAKRLIVPLLEKK